MQEERVEDWVGYQLKRAQHLLRLETDAALRDLHATTPQYAALSGIEAQPGISSAALARYAFVSPQTMNEIIRLLEHAGLIERQAHPEHGRLIQLFLTEAGRNLLQQAHARILAIETRMVTGLSPGERVQLVAWLRQCTANLERDQIDE